MCFYLLFPFSDDATSIIEGFNADQGRQSLLQNMGTFSIDFASMNADGSVIAGMSPLKQGTGKYSMRH